MTALSDFRKMKDEFYSSDPQSPLTDSQKQAFTGLHYYPENPALKFTLAIEEHSKKEMVSIQTSKGDVRSYERFGKITFLVEGKSVSLTIYRAEHGFFLPFVDNQAGKETYPAGRYLEIEPLADGKYLVDFNMAYNPYCAYNDRWSCPITPAENRLKVSIRAGEKIYEKHA
ncbi:MAG: DUF1684 domain-containing protein [Anaerolineaceae bacterium]|jgi:hypothetical protein|nr:MAG: DUF1684 domain-containing protein [Anaerolineaceae bacterium]